MAREIEAPGRNENTGGLGASQDRSQIRREFKNDDIGLFEPSEQHGGCLDRLFHALSRRDQYLTPNEGRTFEIAEMPDSI